MKKFTYSLILLFFLISLKEVYAIEPPVRLTPVNNATNVPIPVHFTWQSVNGATNYSITLYYGFTQIFYQGGITNTDFYSPEGLLQGGTEYFWKVASHAANGDSAESLPPWRFTTGSALPTAPTLVFPSNDTTNMPLTFTFDWNDINNITYYTLQVTTDPNFVNITWTFPGLTSSSYPITTGFLNNSTVYYWRVNATNTTGTGPWSTVWHFGTLPAVPPAPTLQSPANGSTNVVLTPLLNWSDVPVGTVNYDVEVATDNNFGTLAYFAYDIDSSQRRVPAGFLSGTTTYWWRARAKNIGGAGPWSNPYFSFMTQAGPPAPPVLVSPPNYSTNISRNPVLTWQPSGGATSYRVQLSYDSTFATGLIVNTTTANTSYNVTVTLAYDTKYFWHVNATGPGGTSAYSQTWNFRTIPNLLPPPQLQSPICGATNVVLTPSLTWNSVPTAIGYRVQVSSNSAYSALILNTTTSGTSFDVPPGYLTGGFTYYWRVASINSANNEGTFGYPPGFCGFTTKLTLNSILKVYLEGFYNGTTQVQDTINVFLVNPTSPYLFRDSTKAFLKSNGSDTVSFGNITSAGNYYIVIRHRNHLETWSAIPQSFALGTYVNYDFTTSATKAYGNNMKQVGSAWVFYGGDPNQDGIVSEADYNLFRTQFGQDAYRSCDLNGDTFVDGYDLPILYGNIFRQKARP